MQSSRHAAGKNVQAEDKEAQGMGRNNESDEDGNPTTMEDCEMATAGEYEDDDEENEGSTEGECRPAI